MKPSVLVAVGCSWVAGAYMDTDPTATDFDYNHEVDPEFRRQHSFAGLIQQRLGLDQIHFIAANGASNDNQVRNLISFIDSNQKNYSHIFVLWGLSSIYRWETYSANTGTVEDNIHGRTAHRPGIEEEVKYYFSHFWNQEHELEKLGNRVLLVSGYLKNLNIEHLFFNSFQGYSNEDLRINNIRDNVFYRVKEKNNDLLSLLCDKNNVALADSKLPFLNILRPSGTQINSRAVKELQVLGWLDQATSHPTVKAHKLIANELYDYIIKG